MKVALKITGPMLDLARRDLERPHFFAHERVGFLTAGAAAAPGGLMLLATWLVLGERHEHEHQHQPMAHAHLHTHDEHHRHAHDGSEGPEPHAHPHVHAPLRHSHPHLPDLHHRHDHAQ